MTRDLTWLLVVILVGAFIFLTVGIWALAVGFRRLTKVVHWRSINRRHSRLRHHQTVSPASTADQITASKPVNPSGEDLPPWYSALFIALLAILFAWAVVWALQVSGLLSRLSNADQNGISFYGQSLVLPAVALGLVVVFLASSGRQRPATVDKLEEGRAPLLMIGAASGVGMWLVAMFLQRILSIWIPAGLGGTDAFKAAAVVQWVDLFKVGLLGELPAPGGAAGAWLMVLFVVLISPAVSEWFFRGYVLPLWSERWGWSGGLVGSSLLSAVFSLNILGLPAMFLSGIGLGWLARYGWLHSSSAEAVGGTPDQNKGFYRWLPAPLLGAWMAHMIFNLLMVVGWLWH